MARGTPAPRQPPPREVFRPAAPGQTPGALVPGEDDERPAVDLAANGDDIRRTVRRGLRCSTCRQLSRIEMDLWRGGDHIVTLQGCTVCRSGLCKEGNR